MAIESTHNQGKYGHLITDAWRWSRNADVAMTDHLLDRWDQRTPWDAVSPERAWTRGTIVDEGFYGVFTNQTGERPDEVRTFYESGDTAERSYQVAIVARDDALKTVYSMDMLSGPERSYLAALRHRVDAPTEESER